MNDIAFDIPFSFDRPAWLWVLLLVPILVVASTRALAGLGSVRRALALAIRSLVIVAIVMTLARIQRVRRNENLTVMFLMDRSQSVGDHADAQEAYMEAASRGVPPKDRIGVIDFARTPYLEQLPMRGGYFLERGRLPEMPNTDRTDVASAIRLAMAMFPHDTAKRIVLMSDGNDNMGDVLSEARRAEADGVVIDVAPLWYKIRNEVYFDKMIAPGSAEVGEIVSIRMNIHSSRSASGRIDVYHNGRKIALPPEAARKQLSPGNNSFVLKLPIESAGVQRFEARFIPDRPEMDTTTGNNQATAFTFVSARGNVAVMTMNPSHDQVLVDALRSENVKATLLDVSVSVPDLAGLLDYSAIILANVPANLFTDDQQQQMASYVQDMGGGLIMTGGDESFGAGGWIGTPVAEVLPVDLEIKHKRIIPRGALVIVMHSCELPRGNMWGKLVAKKSVDTISSRDYIGVLAYTRSGEAWEVPLQIASNKTAIKNQIGRMQIGDMPDFDATLQLALDGLVQTDAVQKHIILISDGDAQPPSPKVLAGLINGKITCSTIAIGYGQHVREQTLRKIAIDTGGRFYAVRNPRKLPQIFVKESKVIRRPLIVDQPFTPQVSFGLSELLAGLNRGESIPDLGGLVLTSPKPLAQIALVRATTEGEDPVLAHWQRGLGRVVAFTSGYWPKWGTQWTVWPKYSKLWAQIVRWCMRQDAPANFDTYTTIEGNQGRIIVEALDKDADYLNFLSLQSTLIHPTEGARPLLFTQTGPGHYEATFEIDQTGQYLANIAIIQGEDEYLGSMHTGVSMPFSPELRELSTNEALLREVSQITGGRWLDMNAETDDVFAHNLPPTVSKQPAWEWTIAWLLLPLFLLDVAARRLASWLAVSVVVELLVMVVLLFGVGVVYTHWLGVLGVVVLAEVIGWTIRFRYIRPLLDWLTHTVTVLGRTGERSAVALEQLKSARDRVRDAHSPAETPTKRRPEFAGGDEAVIDRKARFETDAQELSGDLREALGAAEGAADAGKRAAADQKSEKPSEQDEATMSRLLKAKRRAQRDADDKKDQSG